MSKQSGSSATPMTPETAIAILGPIIRLSPRLNRLPELGQAWKVIEDSMAERSPRPSPADLNNDCDPLTLAYVALGAKTALVRFQDENPLADMDRFEGELGYIDRVIGHAKLLDRLADNVEFNGVFCYEVAEPFGEEIGRLLLSNDVSMDVKAIAQRLINECS